MTAHDFHTIPLVDRLAIDDLYARQGQAIDGGDSAGWAATFTPDGVFESPTYALVAQGPQALAEFAARSNSAALGRGVQLRHWMTASVLTEAGAGRIRNSAYLMILATSVDSTTIDRSLTVDDTLERIDGEWLLASRVVQRDDAGLAPTAEEDAPRS